MQPGKWVLFGIAVLAAVSAAFATLPFGWAHDAATAIGAAITAYSGAAGIAISAVQKQAAPK